MCLDREKYFMHRLGNGLTLVGEHVASACSAALSILVPCGAAHDTEGQEGLCSILTEMLNKGAGEWNSQQLSQQFEQLGIERSTSTGVEASVFSAAMLPENLTSALELMAVNLLEPWLPADELDSVQQLALQDLLAIEDNPSAKVMEELCKLHYPKPYGVSQLGTAQGISSVTVDSLQNFYRGLYRPGGAIIGVAGNFVWDNVVSVVEKCFSSWEGERVPLPSPNFSAENKYRHLLRNTSQSHLALAYPSVSLGHPDYYSAHLGVGVLSGGMCGRLFVEVREKRGLVYTVSASHSGAKGRGAIVAHAGTTPERAQETLEVLIAELRKLAQGVDEQELDRAKADLKSRLIMRGELPSVRAPAITSDVWNLGFVRSLPEIKRCIEQVTAEDIAQHLQQFPVKPISLVTLGATALDTSGII